MEYYKCFDLKSLIYNHNGIELIEKWMPIVGYEGLYEASDLGRIKSLEKSHFRKRTQMPPKIKSQLHYGKVQYLSVVLNKNGTVKRALSHIIIANAFLPNPLNKRTINHIDGNKLNNMLLNLERATDSENQLHSFYVLGRKPYWKGKRNTKIQKPVFCVNNNKTYPTLTDASIDLNISKGSISNVCSGKRLNARGYILKYA